jgi:hypothetical protein
MIVARLIAPLSKLATAKALDPITAASSLGGASQPRNQCNHHFIVPHIVCVFLGPRLHRQSRTAPAAS